MQAEVSVDSNSVKPSEGAPSITKLITTTTNQKIDKSEMGLKLQLCLLLVSVGFMAYYSTEAYRMTVYQRPQFRGESRNYTRVGRHKTPWNPNSYRWTKDATGESGCCMKTCNDKSQIERHCRNESEASVDSNDKFNWVLIWCSGREPTCCSNPESDEPVEKLASSSAEVAVDSQAEASGPETVDSSVSNEQQ